MVKVTFSNYSKYHGVVHPPLEAYLIDDCDKDEMIRAGATIIENKVVNTKKVEPKVEPKVETKYEPIEEVKEEDTYFNKKKAKKQW